MDTSNKPEITITRIESNFSPSPNHIVSYDLLRKSVIITNVDKPVENKDKYIIVTVNYKFKGDNLVFPPFT